MVEKSTARLKEQARTHEQREEWDLAISVYRRVLQAGTGEEVADLPLYNRIGDLYLRTGRPDEAVRFYEQAADHYAEAGLFNNAIALCNKALRYAPHRADLLRKLGRFSASQGFLTDARRWFLEFAERAFHKGDTDDAIAALDDFADISDDPEIRELLARKLYAIGRLDDALTEYRRAYAMRLRDGAAKIADDLKGEVLERYPELTGLEPHETEFRRTGAEAPVRAGLPSLEDEPETAAEETPPPPPGLPGLDEPPSHVPPATDPAPVAGFEQTSLAPDQAETAKDFGWEDPADSTTVGVTGDLEPTSLAGDDETDDAPAGVAAGPGAGTGTAGSDEYVDLSDFLGLGDEPKKETRFFVEETDPTGDEDRDFAELLAQFKQKLAEHVAHDDIGSHYDLGLAFKEMGLLDEAIGEFQLALRAGDDRLKIFEELGQCFFLKKQYTIAVKVLSRAMQFAPDDEIELIGVYYHLGCAYQELGQRDSAMDAFERVVGLDISFKDVAERMARL